MAPKKEAKAKTSYTVRSVNTGNRICGPYTAKKDAERECARLNNEAVTGRGAPTEDEPDGQQLGLAPGEPVLHAGTLQRYEVVSGEGVVLP